MKVAVVTGASSGIGYETAKALAKKDYCVYAASRNLENMKSLLAYNVKIIHLDVTDQTLIHNLVDHVLNTEGHIDILVNNAGYGSYGAVEDVSIEEARKQFEVNLFGLSELTKAIIPSMRHQNSGKIINISSIGGRTPNNFGSWYHASKYALEGYSESLRLELSDFGIDVIIIQPGGIKTNWAPIAANHLETSSKGGPYESKASNMAQLMYKQHQSGMFSHPSVAAKRIVKIIESNHTKPRYTVGLIAKPMLFLHAILPVRAFGWLLKRKISK